MLKQRAFSAVSWSALDVFLRQGLQFGFTVVLARLLTPSDFGTFGLVLIFTSVAIMAVDGGFSAALIQHRNVNQTDESSVFWFNCLVAAGIACCICAIAPIAADFYNQPALTPLLLVVAANTFSGSLGAIHVSILSKKLDFRTQSKIGVIAVAVSGFFSVLMAIEGWGVWALAAQMMLTTTVTTLLLWKFSQWRPTREFSTLSLRKLLKFGKYNLLANLMDAVYSRLYTVLIGKFDGVRSLGYYQNADNIQQMPGGILNKIISRVAFPMFSESAGDPTALRRGMQLGIRGSMFINVPAMLGMAATAEPLVDFIFGPQWLPAVPILQVLCISGAFLPLHVLNLNCLMALGHGKLMFQIELVKKIVGCIFLGIGAIYGAMGIAWAMAGFSIVGVGINTYFTKRFINFGALEQLRECAAIFLMSIVMAIVVGIACVQWDAPSGLKLLALSVLGSAVFLLGAVAFRMNAWVDILSLIFPAQTSRSSTNHS